MQAKFLDGEEVLSVVWFAREGTGCKVAEASYEKVINVYQYKT